MNIHQYLINDINPVDINSSVRDAKNLARKFTYTHIPIAQNGDYIGCISETDASCFDSEKSIGEYAYAIEPIFVQYNSNWLDILAAFAVHNSNILPVLGEEKKYIGYYELNDIMEIFNNTPFMAESGGIIVVQKGIREYSFSEIAQIVESNSGRLFGMFISQITDNKIEVTVKIGQSNIHNIVQTFRRYNYEIISQHEEDIWIENLKQRSKYLDKFLNI
ncbi:MAG: CBS domain-containing protein [Bacteroidetes bacterium]|nr:CBS domain-containing protein [Bacteroidota bacterium]